MIAPSEPYPRGLGRTLRLLVWPQEAFLASGDSLALRLLPWQQDPRRLTF